MGEVNSFADIMGCFDSVPKKPKQSGKSAKCKGTGDDYAKLATLEEFSKDLVEISTEEISPIPHGGVVMRSGGGSALIDTSDSHSIIISSTGGRKTTLVVIPTIYAIARAGESAIVADPKGEIYDATRAAFEHNGYRIQRINLRDIACSSKWNPLTIPYLWFHSEDINLHNMGETMLFDFVKTVCPVKSTNDPYWEKAGQNALMGCASVLFRYCDDMDMVNLRSLSSILRLVTVQDEDMVRFVEGLDPGDTMRESLEPLIRLPDSTRHCITSVASASIAPYTVQDSIASLLSRDEIRSDKIAEDKTVIFITTPDERTTYNAIVSCFIKQSYGVLLSQAESNREHALPRRVNYIIDEFASFPKIDDFDSMISAARSRNIRFTLILQGLTQLNGIYGIGGRNIWGNCSNTFFLTSREDELLDSIVKLGGRKKNGETLFNVAGLQRLDKDSGECIVFHGRCRPFISTFVMFDRWADSNLVPEDQSVDCEFVIPKVFSFDPGEVVNGVSEKSVANPPDNSPETVTGEIIGALRTVAGYGGMRGAIERVAATSGCAESGFHKTVRECIETFDFSEDFTDLRYRLAIKLMGKGDSQEEVLEYINKCLPYITDFCLEVATEIRAAFGIIRGMSVEEFDKYAKDDIVSVEPMSDDPEESPEDLIARCIAGAPSPDNVPDDVTVVSFDFLEALIVRYATRAEIMSHVDEYRGIIAGLDNPIAAEAFEEALHKISILSDDQIKEIRSIVMSRCRFVCTRNATGRFALSSYLVALQTISTMHSTFGALEWISPDCRAPAGTVRPLCALLLSQNEHCPVPPMRNFFLGTRPFRSTIAAVSDVSDNFRGCCEGIMCSETDLSDPKQLHLQNDNIDRNRP